MELASTSHNMHWQATRARNILLGMKKCPFIRLIILIRKRNIRVNSRLIWKEMINNRSFLWKKEEVWQVILRLVYTLEGTSIFLLWMGRQATPTLRIARKYLWLLRATTHRVFTKNLKSIKVLIISCRWEIRERLVNLMVIKRYRR